MVAGDGAGHVGEGDLDGVGVLEERELEGFEDLGVEVVLGEVPLAAGVFDLASARPARSKTPLSDLSACTVGQYVGYPTTGNFYNWPSPPFSGGNINPIVKDLAATLGGFSDDNSSAPFVKPYTAASFTATQFFRYRCPCFNQGNYVNVAGPISIVRSVTQNANGSWKCTITKSGSSATLNPLP